MGASLNRDRKVELRVEVSVSTLAPAKCASLEGFILRDSKAPIVLGLLRDLEFVAHCEIAREIVNVLTADSYLHFAVAFD